MPIALGGGLLIRQFGNHCRHRYCVGDSGRFKYHGKNQANTSVAAIA